MMGERDPQAPMWSYRVNLDKRVSSDHPLPWINEALELSFVRAQGLAPCRSKMKTRRRATRFHRAISQIGIAASLSLNPHLLRATRVCLHMDLFASVRQDDLERGGRTIQSHGFDLGFGRQGVSDG
jgi:hypothetical protein